MNDRRDLAAMLISRPANVVVSQMRLVPDAAEHEELRRIKGAAAQNDFASAIKTDRRTRGSLLKRTGLVEVVAFDRLDSDGARRLAVTFENDTRNVVSGRQHKPIRISPLSLKQKLANSNTASKSDALRLRCSRLCALICALSLRHILARDTQRNQKNAALRIEPSRIEIIGIKRFNRAESKDRAFQEGDELAPVQGR